MKFSPIPLLTFIIVCLLLLGGPKSSAQVTEQIVGEIAIEFVDIRNISDEAVRARLQIREGMPYSQVLVDRSIRSLYETRFFDFIEARTENLPGGRVRVVFSLQARYLISDIQLVGFDRFKIGRAHV